MSENNAYEGMVNTKRRTDVLAAPIKAMLKAFFAEQGIIARPIHRTAPERFGNAFGGNCPHNFLSKSAKADHITIYMEFKDADIHLGNFIRIIAYPDSDAANLHRHPKSKSGIEKVDLDRLPDKYIFRDWDDLKANYHRILARE